MTETFTSTVLSMVHVALNNGRTGVEVMLRQAHKTRLLLRASQIVLVVDHRQNDTAIRELLHLSEDVAKQCPDVMEYRVLSVCRGMLDTASGMGVGAELARLIYLSRMFTAVVMSDFVDARRHLDAAIAAEDV